MGAGNPVAFRGRVRWWDPEKGGGLAVVDVPDALVAGLGGRKQARLAGSLGGVPFSGSGMLVAGGGYCVGLRKAALTAAGIGVGDEVEVVLGPAS